MKTFDPLLPVAAVLACEPPCFLFYLLYIPALNLSMSVLGGRLDVYIHDYLLKRNLQSTAKAFQAEGSVSSDPVGQCINF